MYFLKQRITIPEIEKHPWFVKNLLTEFIEDEEPDSDVVEPKQSIEEVISIIQEARKCTMLDKQDGKFVGGDSMELDDEIDTDDELEDEVDTSGDFVCAM